MTQGPIPDVDTKLREQAILNRVYDEITNSLKMSSGADASKIVISGSYTYIAVAAPGTAVSSAFWRCKRLDGSTSGTILTTWADGDTEFDNVATDLAALNYI